MEGGGGDSRFVERVRRENGGVFLAVGWRVGVGGVAAPPRANSRRGSAGPQGASNVRCANPCDQRRSEAFISREGRAADFGSRSGDQSYPGHQRCAVWL